MLSCNACRCSVALAPGHVSVPAGTTADDESVGDRTHMSRLARALGGERVAPSPEIGEVYV